MNRLLGIYSTGYKINEKKYVIMGLNIEEILKNKLGYLYTAEWRQKGVPHLGV